MESIEGSFLDGIFAKPLQINKVSRRVRWTPGTSTIFFHSAKNLLIRTGEGFLLFREGNGVPSRFHLLMLRMARARLFLDPQFKSKLLTMGSCLIRASASELRPLYKNLI